MLYRAERTIEVHKKFITWLLVLFFIAFKALSVLRGRGLGLLASLYKLLRTFLYLFIWFSAYDCR